jgi:uncharacterized protein with PIN domain
MKGKYTAEEPLGRLARWLRLLGVDVEYQAVRPSKKDGETSERRTLISRKKNILPDEGILINSDGVENQLMEFLSIKGVVLLEESLFSRCSGCNFLLEEISKELAGEFAVPEYVLFSSTRFTFCSQCRKVYWQGTHRERFMETLRAMGVLRQERG